MLTQLPYNDAICKVARSEYLMDVTSDDKKIAKVGNHLEVDGANLPVLSQLSKLFDRFVIESISVTFKSAVATTRDGFVYVAIDYDGVLDEKDLTVSKILRYPNQSGPVRNSFTLPLKYDRTPRYVHGTDFRDKLGRILVYATCGEKNLTLGTIFVNYNITLMSLTG
jgi:hypothetical protein